MATPQQQPPAPRNVAHDLTDAEFAELDELLERTPEPLEPVDAVMLDGFLCGVLVQPVLLQAAAALEIGLTQAAVSQRIQNLERRVGARLFTRQARGVTLTVEGEAWLPHVFDFDGRPLPDEVDPVWRDRVVALTLRRHAALNRALVDDGWFDPLVLEFDAPEGDDATSEEQADDPAADLGPISRALMPWVAGFQHAALSFPDLAEMPDESVMAALARLYRHLPAETPEEIEVVATLDRGSPLASLDDAMEELVATVADLYDLTRDQRYKVDTVKREAPKVGRNDPCPCGSGKKFKQCHGA